jgi:hypothetical protein
MSDTEQLLRETLQRHAKDAPIITEYHVPAGDRRKAYRNWLLPAVAVVATAAIVAFVAWADGPHTPSEGVASEPPVLRQIEGLTGSAVAESLSLEGHSNPQANFLCDTSIAVDQDGVAYCLDGVTDDPAVRMVVGWQVGGLPNTPSTLSYAQAVVELNAALQTHDAGDPTLYDLEARVKELKGAVAQERRDAPPEGQLVTNASELDATWRAQSLFGKAVTQPSAKYSHPIDVTFRTSAAGRQWSTDDGCNGTAGKFLVNSSGKLVTRPGVSSAVGCFRIPAEREHAANVGAIQAADEARITRASDGSRTLTLLSDGKIVGVYAMVPGSE